MSIKNNPYHFEKSLETRLRKWKWVIPLITLLTGGLLYAVLASLHQLFDAGYYWVIVLSGAVGHAFFIVIVHDGAHKSITRSKLDRGLMNLGSAVMFLPFYGELFRKFHLIHHVNTNSSVDPLWPEFKKELYESKRWLYLLCECIPLLFTLYVLTRSNKENKKNQKTVKGPAVNYLYMCLAILLSVILIVFLKPQLWFVLGTLFVLNLFRALRHWCEHMGESNNKESNTFWFPLGMGIGNHDTHHHMPHLSWMTLLIGLFYRKKSTSPLKTLYGILFKKSFTHFHS